jgi:Mn2+/Fe2+ NRAMP family transporter
VINKIFQKLLTIGPAFFAIGYTIGTGSVTSMVVAGSTFGMQLLWVLVLSCFFSWVLIEAYGRYTLVTGETALYGFKNRIRYGKLIAILIIIGITIGQWNSMIGILGISANVIFESLELFIPGLNQYEYAGVLTIALLIVGIMYALLWVGKYSFFEKILVFFVSFMGLSFIFSLFIVLPDPGDLISGLVPRIPEVEGGKMLVAAFVGTTMAAATFLSRPLFIKGKGWTIDNLKDQRKDALWAAILIFVICTSIMAVTAGALYKDGKVVTRVLDMVYTLEPIAGKYAMAIFFFGTLSAGLSSIFPIMMITPILIADYQAGELDTSSTQFRILAGIACIIGMVVPVFGANPITMQILGQVFNVFVLPLVILGIIILMNNRKLMGEYKATLLLNVGLFLALIFSIVISYNGVIAIIEKIQSI